MSRKVFESKAPCRVDLSGGTLDLWPLYLNFDQGLKLNNMAIQVYAHARIELFPSKKNFLEIESLDLALKKSYRNKNQIQKELTLSVEESPLRWLLRVSDFFLSRTKLGGWSYKLTTWSEVPPGSGLGGSSTLGVAMATAWIQALKMQAQYKKKPWHLQEVLRNLESVEIAHPAGEQDYVPALFGGLMTLSCDVEGKRVIQHSSALAKKIASKMALVYTGKPHHSGINNWAVFKKYIDQNPETHKALQGIHHISQKMAENLQKQSTGSFAKDLNQEWIFRQRLGKSVCAPVLSQAEKWARTYGAQSVKACGAGGGGCLLVYFAKEVQKKRFLAASPISRKWRLYDVLPAAKGAWREL